MASLFFCSSSSSSAAFFTNTCSIQTPTKRSTTSQSVTSGFFRLRTTCSQTEECSVERTGVSCSRREIMGIGGLLAMGLNSLQTLVSPPEADASQATCGKYNVAPSGLAYCDSAIGAGIEATKGMLIKAHYSGRLENGSEFDSSYKRGKPLTFRVGVGEVIRGWDQGILGAEGVPAMQAGGKRTLKIPANLGYGERGAGCRLGSCLIPPNSTLIFDVEFVGKA